MNLRYFIFCAVILISCSSSDTEDSSASMLDDDWERVDIFQSKMINPPSGMVYIPGGKFIWGSQGREAEAHEGPELDAEVSGFYMVITEVTNAEFAAFV